MSTRLELAKNKLERLNNELVNQKSPMDGAPFGQPIVMNSTGKRLARKLQKHQEAMFNKIDAIKEQEESVENLEYRENLRNKGLNASGGLIKSVENLERWKLRVEKLEKERAFAKENKLNFNTPYTLEDGTHFYFNSKKLKDAKETVVMLESMKEKSEQTVNEMSELTKELIENGSVNQWVKKPIYYFVKGLRKVALEVGQNGNFVISKKYPAVSAEDKLFISKLLQGE